MAFGILVLITALSISAVAIYYSVAGLVAIFAAAAIPIIVMGGVLEVGKLVTAVWLHRYWYQAKWWLRTYLALAVVILMFITSMGIFGFLSKAHIEQTSQSAETTSQVSRINTEIARLNSTIENAVRKIKDAENSGQTNNNNVQDQIDREQERIDNAYDRIKPLVEEQNKIIEERTKFYTKQVDTIDAEINKLQGYIDSGDIKKAQQMVGARADGVFGSRTAKKFSEWQDAKKQEKQIILDKIENDSIVKEARAEIKRLRGNVEKEIANSNDIINNLRKEIGTIKIEDNTEFIAGQQEIIKTSNEEIDKLTESKYALEAEYRKLEAEVGPIKYIAEFIYGEKADRDLLEEAVRWVIITIIFVFDPLAVLLLIASQYTFEYNRGGWFPPPPGRREDDEPKKDPEEDPTKDGEDIESEKEPDNDTTPDEPTKAEKSEVENESSSRSTSHVSESDSSIEQGHTLGENEETEDGRNQTTDRSDEKETTTDDDQTEPEEQIVEDKQLSNEGTFYEPAIEKDVVDETITQMKEDQEWWQDQKSMAGVVKVDAEGKVVAEEDGTVEIEDDKPALREYESATGERFKIKADILEEKQQPKIKEKDLENMIKGADEDVLEKVYKEMVNETSAKKTLPKSDDEENLKLEENTSWLPLQRKP